MQWYFRKIHFCLGFRETKINCFVIFLILSHYLWRYNFDVDYLAYSRGKLKYKFWYSKLCFETKMTKVYSKQLLMNSSKNNFIFFTCILSDYVFHESSKEFWKNSHFEHLRADFLSWCQNSLWQTSSEMMHFWNEIKIL